VREIDRNTPHGGRDGISAFTEPESITSAAGRGVAIPDGTRDPAVDEQVEIAVRPDPIQHFHFERKLCGIRHDIEANTGRAPASDSERRVLSIYGKLFLRESERNDARGGLSHGQPVAEKSFMLLMRNHASFLASALSGLPAEACSIVSHIHGRPHPFL